MESERYTPISPEQQFENPELLEIGQEKFKVVDVKPEISKTETPVLVAHGFAATPRSFKENIVAFAENGRRAISIEAPHGVETKGEQEGVPQAELRKMLAVLEMLEKKDINQTDVMAHSEAAIYTCFAAKLHPEKFRNFVLVNPAGMIGKDTFGRLAKDFSRDKIQETLNLIKEKNFSPGTKQIIIDGARALSLHLPKSYQEAKAISGAQIHEMLKDLKKGGHGISVIHSVDDQVFPMERVQKTVAPYADAAKPSHSGKYADMVDGFYSVKGTHNQIVIKPKECTKLADEALTQLEKKHNR